MVEEGATTFWEQWNGYWSRIHSCFTSPDNWLYQGLAGIQADPGAPGFKNVIVKPAFVGDVTWVRSRYDSNYGRIVSNWKRDRDRVTMEVAIPVNSTATVHIPARNVDDVTVNGEALKKAGDVSFLRKENGLTVVNVGSGSYTFTSTHPRTALNKTRTATREPHVPQAAEANR
jgi:alpha-L-rhamnosidase